MTSFFDLAAALDMTYLHPGGVYATETWLRRVPLRPTMRILDLGCGTGATAVQIARTFRAHVIALDRLHGMLKAARRRIHMHRCTSWVHCILADAAIGLPFRDAVLDGIYAESVVALLPLRPLLAECYRILRPGGFLVLIERIWKPGTAVTTVHRLNALSLAMFGIPAAVEPLDRMGWIQALQDTGFTVQETMRVQPTSVRAEHAHRLYKWLRRLRILRRPGLLLPALQFRWRTFRYGRQFASMEPWLFIAIRNGAL